MNIPTLILMAMLAQPGPQAVQALTIHNPGDQIIKVWVWDYEHKAWTARAPIVLGRDGRATPDLAEGRYQFVFKDPEDTLVRVDAAVAVRNGALVFLQKRVHPVTTVVQVVDPVVGGPVPKTVDMLMETTVPDPVLPVPDFAAPPGS